MRDALDINADVDVRFLPLASKLNDGQTSGNIAAAMACICLLLVVGSNVDPLESSGICLSVRADRVIVSGGKTQATIVRGLIVNLQEGNAITMALLFSTKVSEVGGR